jgi:hypothetical protein
MERSYAFQQQPTAFMQQPAMPFLQQQPQPFVQQPYAQPPFAQQGLYAQPSLEMCSVTLALQPDAGGNLVTGQGVAGNKLGAVRRCTRAQVEVQLSTHKRTPHVVHLYGDAWQVACAQAMIAAAMQGADVSTWAENDAHAAAQQQGGMGASGATLGVQMDMRTPFAQPPYSAVPPAAVSAGLQQSYYAAGRFPEYPSVGAIGVGVTLSVPEWNLAGSKLHTVLALSGAQVVVTQDNAYEQQQQPLGGYAGPYLTVQVFGTPAQVAAAQAMLGATTDVTTWTPWDVQSAVSLAQHAPPLPSVGVGGYEYGGDVGMRYLGVGVDSAAAGNEAPPMLPYQPPYEQPYDQIYEPSYQAPYQAPYQEPYQTTHEAPYQAPYQQPGQASSGRAAPGAQLWSPTSAVRNVAKEI